MKKNITLLRFAVVLFVSAYAFQATAQNTSPFWSLAGNNNASSSAKLGTTNADPLNLTTNNFTRLRIGTDGKVGINTISPVSLFHVAGFGSFGNRVTTGNATRALNLVDTAAVMRVLRVHPTNAPSIELISRTTADGANVAYWDMYVEPSDKSFRIRDRQTGSNLDRLTINHGNGYVGVATTNPLAQLHVQGTGSNNVLIGQWTPNNVYAGISMSGSLSLTNYNLLSGAGDQNLYINRPAGNNILFRMANVDQMALNANGDVGIGTTSPAARLDVTDNTRILATTTIRNLNTSGAYNDGLYIYAGRDGGTSSIVTFHIGFYTPTGSVLGSVSQASANSVAYNTTSDKRLKENIRETKVGLADVNKIEVKDYNFIGSKTGQTGFLAQQLYEVFPDAVSKGGSDPKTKPWMVDYGRITPLLVKGMQELSKENEELKKKADKVDALEVRVQKLEALLNTNNSPTTAVSGAYLEQSSPNPARGSALIRYGVPDVNAQARLTLTNANGQVLKEISLTRSRTGQVNLNTASLPLGAYTYTLWVNGQQAASKQLVIAR